METKQCVHCGEHKPLTAFNKQVARKDGLNTWCRTCVNQAKKEYRERNKEKIAAARSKYKKENKQKVLLHKRTYRQKYKAKETARKQEREARKLKATPVWADKKEIELVYEAARAFMLYTGKEYHVDHIVPLKSKVVCGLHCPANLQVLEAVENLRKSNRHWPDMP